MNNSQIDYSDSTETPVPPVTEKAQNTTAFPPPPPKSKTFKVVMVVLAVVTILVLLGIAYLVRSAKDTEKYIESTSALDTQTKNAAVTTQAPTPDPAFAKYEAAGIAAQGTFIRTDADGDAYPDWVETKLGTDPQSAECFDILENCGAGALFAGQEFDRQNVIIVLDSSGSMNAKSGSTTRMELAKEAVLSYAARFENTSVNVGMVVYGHTGNNTEAGKAESCKGISEVYEAQPLTVADFQQSLQTFQATGWTPIAESLKYAEAQLKEISGVELEKSSILLVTDGEETCGGNPQAVAEAIANSGLEVVIDVIALETDDTTDARLRPIAEAGNGVFIAVKNAAELKEKLYEEFKKAQKQTSVVISCSGTVIREFSACRDVELKKIYSYIETVDAEEGAVPISPLHNFLINFDKDIYDVHQAFTEKTKEIMDRVAEVQKQAAEQYKQNAEEFGAQ